MRRLSIINRCCLATLEIKYDDEQELYFTVGGTEGEMGDSQEELIRKLGEME
jgi:hypothetical protein